LKGATRRRAAILAIAALSASGCGAGEGGSRGAARDSGAAAGTTVAAVDTNAIVIRPATLEQVQALVRTPDSLGAGARVVLMNTWATWCVPCREEFPDLMRIHREYRDRGLRLLLVSADFEDELPAARRFLAAQGVDFPTFIKNDDDMRFINGIEAAWTGALPATVLYDAAGGKLWFHEGKVTYEELKTRIDAALPAAAAP
jgi:thiol-disulfide isomerase/thioredoxin